VRFPAGPAGMYQNIWTSGTRLGGGPLRWCSTDKPLNASASFPWKQPLENYSENQVYLHMQYSGNNFYTGYLVAESDANIAVCE